MSKFHHIFTKSVITAATCTLLFSPIHSRAAEQLTTYQYDPDKALHVELLGRYSSGAGIDEGGTEIVAYDPKSHHAFSVNGSAKALDIIDLSVLEKGEQNIPRIKQITLADLDVEASDVTSVAIHPDGGYIAVAAPAKDKVDPGYVVFFSTDGAYLSHVQVGSLPDMLTFTKDGSKVLVANEGEPNDAYTVNPEGTVSIIDVSAGPKSINDEAVTNVHFADDIIDDDVRLVHAESTAQQNLEPEYIVVDDNDQYAYVSLQENNAIAKLDLDSKQFVAVKSLGYKDYSIEKNKLDASNKDDAINIRNWPVLSMYMPDGMATYSVNGKSYILTANEGDAQDYDGFSEEARVGDLADNYDLNADLFEGYSQEELDQMVTNGLFEDEQLGRLTTTTSAPMNQEGKYEAIYGYGARSFSIWDANTLEQTYDSGADFEEITKNVYSEAHFNASNTENEFDNRSDDKGPEPETVTVANIQGGNYAFIGLERIGGIMIYDISNPESPTFNRYFSSRIFTDEEEVTSASGDVAPEGLTFIPANESPTGQNILLAAHEVSGTIAAYQIGIEVKDPVNEEKPPVDNDNDNNTDTGNNNNNDNEQEIPDKTPTEPVDDSKDPTVKDPENKPKPEVEANTDEKPQDESVQKNTSDTKYELATNKINSDSNEEKNEGNKLPNTATMNSNLLLIGSLIIAIGFIFALRKNKTNQN